MSPRRLSGGVGRGGQGEASPRSFQRPRGVEAKAQPGCSPASPSPGFSPEPPGRADPSRALACPGHKHGLRCEHRFPGPPHLASDEMPSSWSLKRCPTPTTCSVCGACGKMSSGPGGEGVTVGFGRTLNTVYGCSGCALNKGSWGDEVNGGQCIPWSAHQSHNHPVGQFF